ncbi:MAG: proprotein convertase P-domain-containing protein [Dokdonella sp.]
MWVPLVLGSEIKIVDIPVVSAVAPFFCFFSPITWYYSPRIFAMPIIRSAMIRRSISAAAIALCWSGMALAQTVFTNNSPITIPALGSASPYPSVITVSGMDTHTTLVTVTLTTLSHTNIRDISILLESPSGNRVSLFNRRGTDAPFTGTLTFDDSAATTLQTLVPFTGGTYKPSGDAMTDPFPGLTGPWATTMSAFNGPDPNGNWNLYIIDPLAGDAGSAAGWSLTVTASTTPVELQQFQID